MYIDYNDVLCHYGVKGMKWGVRRYQNEDGSLTAAGRARYKVGQAANIVGGAAEVGLGAGTLAGLATTGAAIGGTAGALMTGAAAIPVAAILTTAGVSHVSSAAYNLINGNAYKKITQSTVKSWVKQDDTVKKIATGAAVVGGLALGAVGVNAFTNAASNYFLYKVEGDILPKIGKVVISELV